MVLMLERLKKQSSVEKKNWVNATGSKSNALKTSNSNLLDTNRYSTVNYLQGLINNQLSNKLTLFNFPI